MIKVKNIYCILSFALFLICSCAKDSPLDLGPEPEQPSDPLKDGFNYTPSTLDADKELKITFKAAKSSALYGYRGDVYLHTGIIFESVWGYVPAAWEENISKCKMTKGEDNVWSITLSPSIRQWFGSGASAVLKLGVLVRSADGTKKGIEADSFVEVTDNKYDAFQPAEIKESSLPANVKEGINVVDNSAVTLVLYDKDTNGNHKDFAHVVGDFNNWTLSNDEKSQMFRDNAAGCWWITVKGLDASKEYAFQYYVGIKGKGTMRLADAYARKILDPDNDKLISAATYPDKKEYPAGAIGIASVFKIQADTYHWKVSDFKIADKENLVIYELLLRDFSTTGQPGTGDLAGAMTHLDYLKKLGVNAIELMPVQEFDGNNSWGYNPCFYFAMDKAYGTDKMYKDFIDACHERGMAVILDVVYNHATGSHPFAKLYWDSEKSKTAANNPWFNVDAPHPFSVYHDFNHESPLVRAFVKRNLKFLLTEYKFDGFRFDLTKGFTQQRSTEANASNKDNTRIAILKDYNQAIMEINPNAFVILEHFCAIDEEAELAGAGMKLWRELNQAYCQSAMGYNSDGCDFTELTTWNTSMPANSWVGFMESHDKQRMSYKQTAYAQEPLKSSLSARMKQLEVNTVFFLTLSGPKMIWQFGEVGYDYSINSNSAGTVTGEEGSDEYKTNPKPVKWDYYAVPERLALYNTYSKLMTLRNQHRGLFSQNAFKDWKVTEAYWAQGRTITLESVDGNRLVVVGNFTNLTINILTDFQETGTWYDYMNGETLNVISATQSVSVPAHEFRLYTNFAANKREIQPDSL